MAKYTVISVRCVSQHLGTVEADSQEEAEEKADELFIRKDAGGLCHQCSRRYELSDVDEILVEKQE
jgi:hypothetical protein